MLALKLYQQNTLDVLKAYCQSCVELGNPDDAFYRTTRDVFGRGVAYRPIVELAGVPYICVRIPTGGGKTLVAAHSTGVIAHTYLHTDFPVVLWPVPLNPMVQDLYLRVN